MAACDGPVQFHRVLNRIGASQEESNRGHEERRKERSANSMAEDTGKNQNSKKVALKKKGD